MRIERQGCWNKFKTKYSHAPKIYAEYGYNSVKLLAYVMEQAGSAEVEKIKQILYNTHDYQGASGLINFDENGEVVGKEYDVWQVKNGKFVKVE